jgi:hypothetical protein
MLLDHAHCAGPNPTFFFSFGLCVLECMCGWMGVCVCVLVVVLCICSLLFFVLSSSSGVLCSVPTPVFADNALCRSRVLV